jgi:ribonuclease HII
MVPGSTCVTEPDSSIGSSLAKRLNAGFFANLPHEMQQFFGNERVTKTSLTTHRNALGSLRMTATTCDRLAFERDLWKQGLQLIAGVDEAGRGPLAGPVVAAAVILPNRWAESGFDARLEKLNDSKQLTERQREDFFTLLTAHPEIRHAIARVDAETIDRINILQATHCAMNEALAQLSPTPEHALVDGLRVKSLRWPQTPIVKGDAKSYSIAAASVLAKVTRDRLMLEYHQQFPAYGFAEHKGYGTPAHLAAIAEHGPCPIHRKSFAPMKAKERELF